MSVDFSNTLIVAVSATALFDLSESERFFQQALTEDPETAIDKFRSYMIERENDPLQTGTGYPLIKALLNLNHHCAADDKGEGIWRRGVRRYRVPILKIRACHWGLW